MLSATDAFPDSTLADQRHTQAVIGDHSSDIDEDEQEEDEATSRSLDVGTDDEAPPHIDDVLVAHGICGDTDACMTADVAAPIIDADDAFSAIDPPPRRSSRALLGSPPLDGDPSHGWSVYTDSHTHCHAHGRFLFP